MRWQMPVAVLNHKPAANAFAEPNARYGESGSNPATRTSGKRST